MKKVWFRESEGNWYVTVRENGRRRQLLLVKAPNTRDGKKLAESQLVDELAARKHQEGGPPTHSWMLVSHVLNGFLKHSQEQHDPGTYAWYKNFLDSFTAKWGTLRITLLKKNHVQAWLKDKAYNPTSQNRAISAIKRAFNWAVEEEHIARSPVAHLRKPKSLVRDRILTPDERRSILAAIKDQCFRDFVHGMTFTGCRPGEVARVDKEIANVEAGLWIFAKHKTAKKTGRPRVVYLCPDALDLTKRLLAARTDDGPIFRNSRGKPWTRNAIRIRFRTLREKHPELKGVIAYTYRSSFATDALEAGVPDATVASLLGHTNTATLHKFYARLSHKVEHLKDAAKKAQGPSLSASGTDEPRSGTTA